MRSSTASARNLTQEASVSQRRARQARKDVAVTVPARRGPDWRRLGTAAGAVLVVGLLAAGLILARTGSGPSTNAAPAAATDGAAAPAISGNDPVTGRDVSLAAFAGKPVVLNIWASWCPGCIAEASDLKQFAAEHPEAQVIGIDYQDSKSGARDFYRQYRWEHPSVFDPGGGIAASLGLQGLPTTLFLDARHRIVTRIVGQTDLAGFTEGLRRAEAES
jgi:thiol-disulfide isomerase/thioredoxin